MHYARAPGVVLGLKSERKNRIHVPSQTHTIPHGDTLASFPVILNWTFDTTATIYHMKDTICSVSLVIVRFTTYIIMQQRNGINIWQTENERFSSAKCFKPACGAIQRYSLITL